LRTKVKFELKMLKG